MHLLHGWVRCLETHDTAYLQQQGALVTCLDFDVVPHGFQHPTKPSWDLLLGALAACCL